MRLIDAYALEAVMMAKALNDKERTWKTWAKAIDAIHDAPTVEPMQWIPVTKRMPDADTEVWVQCETQCGNAYCCEAVYFPRWTKEAGYDQWDECSEYNEEEDAYYVIEGWYERIHNWDDYAYVVIEDTVVAWCELPALYKGE